jgi:hypothetical protein
LAKAVAAGTVIVTFTFQQSLDGTNWSSVLDTAGNPVSLAITNPTTAYCLAATPFTSYGRSMTLKLNGGYLRCLAAESNNVVDARVTAYASGIPGGG